MSKTDTLTITKLESKMELFLTALVIVVVTGVVVLVNNNND